MKSIAALLALLTSAPRPDCEALWPRVWRALEQREFRDGLPPLFQRVPGAKEQLGAAWTQACRRFDAAALACARGEQLEADLEHLRRRLVADGASPEELEAGLRRMRESWSALECREVRRALDRAAQQVAADAGL